MASEIQTLESEKEDLNDKIAELKKKMKKIEDEAVDESVYDNLFDGITLYANGDKDAAAETLIKVDISALESKPAKELYNKIKEETFEAMSTKKYAEGSRYYNRGNYEEAVEFFELALKYNENNANAMYYLGRVYQRNGDNKNAKKYYKKIINEYPNDPRYGDASRRLEEITAAE
ncbi:MAG: tetratricopeptide repeat protein [Clostridia bacterium]|nr:tetratricopeptide repeat protein [Clostridia bacterium]